MTIISFVKTLPENLVYAPIYKKDALMKSGRKATGKNPLEESWERDFDKHDVELAIEKNPDSTSYRSLYRNQRKRYRNP